MSFQYQILSFLAVTYSADFSIRNHSTYILSKVIPQFSAEFQRQEGSPLIECHSLF